MTRSDVVRAFRPAVDRDGAQAFRPAVCTAILLAISMALFAQAPQAPTPAARPVFRSALNIVLVDVVVRDQKGSIVTGLKADDFEVSEDGKPQQIASFAFEEIGARALASGTPLGLPSAAPGSAVVTPPEPAADLNPADAQKPLTSDEAAGHRLMVLLFDTSSMQYDEIEKAADSALKWVDEQMTPSDLVAVASIGASLEILSDFTSDKATVRGVLQGFTDSGGPVAAIDASTASTDAAAADTTATADAADATAVDVGTQELDTFNNDVRLRALTTLAESLTPLQQKKAILYFSSGMQRNGSDNQIELRKAINAAVRANVAIYPVDSRGLQAVVPGGAANQAGRGGGVNAFSGRGVAQQFARLGAQQETLQALAEDTGGTAFTDANDFGEAFTRVTKDISSYYILGFTSTNQARDGRFRRIRVRLKNRSNVRLEAREGYYADRDFAHTARTDREALLQEQLMAPIPATDVPVFVTAGWFRLAADRYYVPVSLAVPGSAVPASADKVTLDVAGFIRDERGQPVGRIRDTLTVPPASADGLGARQVLYQTGMTLPPGRFTAKIVVRENADGKMGTFETAILVPELKQAPVKISSIVLSTQLKVTAGRTQSPLVRNGVEVVPNLTHIIGRDQKMYVYYEVYDPTLDAGAPQVRTSLIFYRGKVKVFETPVVERTEIDAADRHAALFQFEVPAAALKPGRYTCQINVVDAVAGKFAFPRLDLLVR